MAKTILIFVAREDSLTEIPKTLRRLRETGRCDFCNEKIIYNRENYKEQKSKGLDPVLICSECYGQGEHMRQRYGAL